MSYLVPLPTLVPIVFTKSLAEHVTGRFGLLILAAPCWIEAPWLPTALNMLEDISHQCSVIKDLMRDVLVSQVLKGLQPLHLTHWLCRFACYTEKGSLL